MSKLCRKCGYTRKFEDNAPDYACPKCGAVYAKVEAHLLRLEQEAVRNNEIKQQLEEDTSNKWGLSKAMFVKIIGNELIVRAKSIAEIKLALKELKLKKKELSLAKRILNEEQKQIRSQYTEEVRFRGSMIRGGGGLGKFLRAVQTASRDSKRAALARNLSPYEVRKQEIESMLRAIDSAILQVEAALLKTGG